MLRPYQQTAITMLYEYFRSSSGHPCIVMPTGSGKSHVIAYLCKDALTSWPDTRILMLTHQKELIEQNAQKLRLHWPNAPLGIFSAGIGSREIDAITFAGIQSIWRNAESVPTPDLVIIDEAHSIAHKAEGMYRKLLYRLEDRNPKVRVIGLTATPFRLGHGMITDKPAIFDDIIEPISIDRLVKTGYLAPLTSKVTAEKLDTSGVHLRGGEFIAAELQKAVDVHHTSEAVVEEVLKRAGDRKSWLFFCSGVSHAEHVAEILNTKGIKAKSVTGGTPKLQREQILDDFKTGKVKAITNMGVLTTGFDYPGIDLIVMMRPTMSPGLYMQMAGRGMRMAEGKADCLVLDFASNVLRHGPVTQVQPPRKPGEGNGVPPAKCCPDCDEIIHASAKICPSCGHAFPAKKKEWQLASADIMGNSETVFDVSSWSWKIQQARSGIDMIVVTYYGGISDNPIREYLCVFHEGFAGRKGMAVLREIADHADVDLFGGDLEEVLLSLSHATPPGRITYVMDGRYPRVTDRDWIAPIRQDAGEIVDIYF